ncbi:MAG: hypothetical protein ABIG90_00015, partial [bacterium]
MKQKLNKGIVFSIGLLILGFAFTGAAFATELPDLVVTAIIAPAKISIGGQIDEQISVSWTVKNQGEGQAAGFCEDALYLSSDNQL